MRKFMLGGLLSICAGRVTGVQQDQDPTWMTVTWSPTDSQLRTERVRIEALEGKRGQLDAEIKLARAKCDAKNVTRVDLFRWACATLVRGRGDFDYAMSVFRSDALKKPYELFPRFSLRTSYEFTRVRMMFTTAFDFPNHTMVPMAESLHEREPADLSVALALLHLYQPGAPHRYPQDRSKGIKLIQFLDQHFKANLRVLAGTGYFYYLSWTHTKSVEDASEAIRRSGEAFKLSASAEQRRLIEREKAEMVKGTAGLPK